MSDVIRVRRVMHSFSARRVTEDNAIEVAVWLRDQAATFQPPPSPDAQPVVSFAGPRPVLRADWGGPTVQPGSWIGWGWPNLIHEGDIGTPRLLVLTDESIARNRPDQGFEQVPA